MVALAGQTTQCMIADAVAAAQICAGELPSAMQSVQYVRNNEIPCCDGVYEDLSIFCAAKMLCVRDLACMSHLRSDHLAFSFAGSLNLVLTLS